jgi:hypothetical protein
MSIDPRGSGGWRCALAVLPIALALVADPSQAQHGGLHTNDGEISAWFARPVSVRNVQPLPGEEVTILRSFKIEKGSYAEFHRRSVEEIWPYFEKIGARIIGMWRVDPSSIEPGRAPDYDEAILLTRYASLDHWRASRSAIELGGNGPDAEALAAAHAYRQSVTIETSFSVLRGRPADNGPYHMPAVAE